MDRPNCIGLCGSPLIPFPVDGAGVNFSFVCVEQRTGAGLLKESVQSYIKILLNLM